MLFFCLVQLALCVKCANIWITIPRLKMISINVVCILRLFPHESAFGYFEPHPSTRNQECDHQNPSFLKFVLSFLWFFVFFFFLYLTVLRIRVGDWKMLKMLGMNVICILRLFPQESGYFWTAFSLTIRPYETSECDHQNRSFLKIVLSFVCFVFSLCIWRFYKFV